MIATTTFPTKAGLGGKTQTVVTGKPQIVVANSPKTGSRGGTPPVATGKAPVTVYSAPTTGKGGTTAAGTKPRPPIAEVAIHETIHNTSASEAKAQRVLYAEATWADDADDLWEGQQAYEKQKYAQSYEKFTSIPNQQHRRSSKLDVETSGSYIRSTILQTAITFAQGLALDALFNVDLTSAQTGDYSDWRGWSAREINLMFGSVVRQAATFNQVAQQNGFTPPDPTWLFRNINGPLEVRQVDSLGGLYGQVSSLQSAITLTLPDGSQRQYTGRWGQVQQALQGGATWVSGGSSLIRLTNDAFFAGTVTPEGSDITLSFPTGFIIDHELGHLPSLNWYLPDQSGHPTSMETVYGERIAGNFNAGIPNLGARSKITPLEYLADATAYLTTNNYDPENVDQADRQQLVENLLWDLIEQKFNQ